MRMRALVIAAVTAAVLPAVPGQAAACPLITDARGDATPVHYGQATPVDDSLGKAGTDILSADAWSDGKRLIGVIRLAELPAPTDVPRAHGYEYWVRLRAEGGAITLYALEDNGNWEYNAVWETIVGSENAGASAPVNLHNTVGTPDLKRGEIRLSVPLDMFAPYTKISPGVRWMPSAWSFILLGGPSERAGVANYGAYVGPGGVGNQSDRADGTRPVTVGRPQCSP